MWFIFASIVQAEEPTLQRQLSQRDSIPSCALLVTQHDNLQMKLQQLVNADIKPSYVPMRAAGCLLELYPRDVDTYREWMIAPENKGLAFLVINKMEKMPVEVSVSLAQSGLEGAHAKGVRTRLERVRVVEIQELLAPVVEPSGEE